MGIDVVDVETAEGGRGRHGAVGRSLQSWRRGRVDYYHCFSLVGSSYKGNTYFFFNHTPLESAGAGAGGLKMRDLIHLEWKYPELR